MNIGNILNQVSNAFNNNGINAQGSANLSDNVNLLEKSLQSGLRLLDALQSGSTVSGQIISIEGNKILLNLGNNNVINAKVEGNLLPTENSIMNFLVNKSADGKNISLSPLFVNLNADSNISNALKEANLPDTPENQYMVSSMMKEGLSVDKQSLYAMNKAVNTFNGVDPAILSKMTSLDLTINENSIKQFVGYMNYENLITDSLLDITDSLTESFDMVRTMQGDDKALAFIADSLEILLPENDESVINETHNINLPDTAEQLSDEGIKDNSIAGIVDKNPELKLSLKELTQSLKTLEFSDDVISKIKDGSIKSDDLNNTVKSFIKDIVKNSQEHIDSRIDNCSDKIKQLMDNDLFKQTLKESLKDKWLLKPEDVAIKDSVSKLYEKINSQIKNLTDMILEQNKEQTPLSNAAQNVSNSIEFMNELNQTFNYVQIPLKMANQNANGELYVYTNKRSLAQDDGTVSALLHLDMDNLGPVDVHVMLNTENQVKTKFFLKDDEALDLIAQNINILDERLNKRGYSMNAEFINKDDDKTVFDTMIEDGRNVPNLYSMNSFDARA